MALAQTADGYLWLGTSDGLFRFDGLTFDRYKPDAGTFTEGGVSALFATSDDGLWIGYEFGGVSLLKNGRLTSYAPAPGVSIAEGLPRLKVNGFAQTRDGTLWVATVGGLGRLVKGRWIHIGMDWKYNGRPILTLFVDRAGTLWVACYKEVYFLLAGATEFQQADPIGALVISMSQARDGALWYGRSREFLETMRASGDQRQGLRSRIEIPAFQILFDRDGALWIAGDGVTRVLLPEGRSGAQIVPAAVETLTYKDHLTDVYAKCLLEDREGNIWVGTEGGLERFRNRNLTWFGLLPGTRNFSLVAGDNGDIYAWPKSVNKELRRGVRVQDGKLVDGEPDNVQGIYRNPSGAIFLADSSYLWEWKAGRFLKIQRPEGGRCQVTAMTAGQDGDMWISRMTEGLFLRRSTGEWIPVKVFDDDPKGKAEAACTDAAGRVWFAYHRRVAMLDHGRISTFLPQDGLGVIGNIHQIASSEREIWVSGVSGVAFLQAGRFHALNLASGKRLGSVRGILTTPNDGLWLSATPGIVHIPETEIQLVRRDPSHPVSFEVFDLISDLPESIQDGDGMPSIVRATDGFLWFATRQGAARIDPAHIFRNPLPPPVSIRSITADGKSYSTFAPATLPPLTKDLQIDYTALSLSIPERVQFRYKLVGRDETWQDVGGRRQAFFSNLKPRNYTFRVIACNNDGVWNEAGTAWSFRVEPAFYQTMWFQAFCLMGAIAFGWLVYVFRVKRATSEIQARLGERLVERERIARELHDTLLQGFNGLVLRFEAAMKQIPRDTPARLMMESALDRADQVLLEGRSRVRDLRSEAADKHDLAESFAKCGAELSSEGAPSFSVLTSGTPQMLDPIIRDEIYRIGREALVNAFQHSEAAKIEVELTYDDTRFRLRVRDDGRGIEQEVLDKGRPGHWGLAGIRERAQNIGGKISMWSRAGAGTEIELLIPAKLVYRTVPKVSGWQGLKRLF